MVKGNFKINKVKKVLNSSMSDSDIPTSRSGVFRSISPIPESMENNIHGRIDNIQHKLIDINQRFGDEMSKVESRVRDKIKREIAPVADQIKNIKPLNVFFLAILVVLGPGLLVLSIGLGLKAAGVVYKL